MLLAAMLLVYCLGVLYLAGKILRTFRLPEFSAKKHLLGCCLAAALLLSLIPLLPAVWPAEADRNLLRRTGNLLLGYAVYLFMLFILSDFCRFILKKIRGSRPGKKGRQALLRFACFSLVSILIMAAGTFHAEQLKITGYQVTVSSGKVTSLSSGSDLKIAFVADLHMGAQVGSRQIRKMAELINGLDADLVLFGGDIFNSDYEALENPQELMEILRSIHSRYGMYAVYGNHDVTETLIGGFSISPVEEAYRDPRMDSFLQNCGIWILEDEAVTAADGRICLVGRLDGQKSGTGTKQRLSAEAVMKQADTDLPVIVLEHEPSEVQQLSDLGADLVLAGHTHDGQFFPLTLARSFIWDNPCGLKMYGTCAGITTSGVGFYGPPIRVLTDAEVVSVTLHIGNN